jgi:hypothetical protein
MTIVKIFWNWIENQMAKYNNIEIAYFNYLDYLVNLI